MTRELLAWRLDVLIEAAQFDEDRIPFDSGDGFFNAANYAAQVTRIANDPSTPKLTLHRVASSSAGFALRHS